MPITLTNGATVPVGSDPYNLTADLLKLAKSLNLPIIVNNVQDRDNLPDKYDGMTVIRNDFGGIQQIYNAGTWFGSRSVSSAFTVPGVAALESVSVDISYPPNVFPPTPRPTVTPPSSRLTASVTDMTATGFRAVFANSTSAASSPGLAVWHAIYTLL